MSCKYFTNNNCELAKELVGVECQVKEDACKACSSCLIPQQLNYVVYSVALQAVKGTERHRILLAEWTQQDYFTLGLETPITLKLAPGIGTELHTILASKGYHITAGCKCLAMMYKMNAGGKEWVLANEEEIVDTMLDEAKKRGLRYPEVGMRFFAQKWIRKATSNYEKSLAKVQASSGRLDDSNSSN